MIWVISYGPYRNRLEPYCFILYDIHRVYRRLAIAYNLWILPKPLATTSKTMLWFSFNSNLLWHTDTSFTQGLYFCSGLLYPLLYSIIYRHSPFWCPVLLRMSDTRRAVIESWYPLHRVTLVGQYPPPTRGRVLQHVLCSRPHFTFVTVEVIYILY